MQSDQAVRCPMQPSSHNTGMLLPEWPYALYERHAIFINSPPTVAILTLVIVSLHEQAPQQQQQQQAPNSPWGAPPPAVPQYGAWQSLVHQDVPASVSVCRPVQLGDERWCLHAFLVPYVTSILKGCLPHNQSRSISFGNTRHNGACAAMQPAPY